MSRLYDRAAARFSAALTPASAMLCLSGECHLLPYPAGNISAKLTGKRPPVSSPSLCASSITCLLGSYWRRGVLAAKF